MNKSCSKFSSKSKSENDQNIQVVTLQPHPTIIKPFNSAHSVVIQLWPAQTRGVLIIQTEGDNIFVDIIWG